MAPIVPPGLLMPIVNHIKKILHDDPQKYRQWVDAFTLEAASTDVSQDVVQDIKLRFLSDLEIKKILQEANKQSDLLQALETALVRSNHPKRHAETLLNALLAARITHTPDQTQNLSNHLLQETHQDTKHVLQQGKDTIEEVKGIQRLLTGQYAEVLLETKGQDLKKAGIHQVTVDLRTGAQAYTIGEGTVQISAPTAHMERFIDTLRSGGQASLDLNAVGGTLTPNNPLLASMMQGDHMVIEAHSIPKPPLQLSFWFGGECEPLWCTLIHPEAGVLRIQPVVKTKNLRFTLDLDVPRKRVNFNFKYIAEEPVHFHDLGVFRVAGHLLEGNTTLRLVHQAYQHELLRTKIPPANKDSKLDARATRFMEHLNVVHQLLESSGRLLDQVDFQHLKDINGHHARIIDLAHKQLTEKQSTFPYRLNLHLKGELELAEDRYLIRKGRLMGELVYGETLELGEKEFFRFRMTLSNPKITFRDVVTGKQLTGRSLGEVKHKTQNPIMAEIFCEHTRMDILRANEPHLPDQQETQDSGQP